MIFFDKFCPDLHRGSSSSSSSTSFTRDEHASLEQTSGAQSNEISRLKAACRWCRAELGCPSVVILSDDDDDDDLSGERLPGPSEAFREGDAGTTPRTRDSDDGFWGPAPAARPREAVRVSGLEEFVREFVGRGEREAELLRRGALLFSAYQAMKVREDSVRHGWILFSPLYSRSCNYKILRSDRLLIECMRSCMCYVCIMYDVLYIMYLCIMYSCMY